MVSHSRKVKGIALCLAPIVAVGILTRFDGESLKSAFVNLSPPAQWTGWQPTPKPAVEVAAPAKTVHKSEPLAGFPVFSSPIEGLALAPLSPEPVELTVTDIAGFKVPENKIDCQVAPNNRTRYSDFLTRIREGGSDSPGYRFRLARVLQKSDGRHCTAAAFHLFLNSADGGYRRALAEIANAYRKGIGVKADFPMAVKYFTASARFGHANSAYRLIEMVERGTSQIAGDAQLASQFLDEFLPLIESRIRAGDAIAARSLARLYGNSNLIQRNPDKAIDFFRYAANLGDEIAMHDLALALMKFRLGDLTRKDVLPLLLRSAELGYAAAFTALGRLHLNEVFGLSREPALDWFRRGVELGHPGAMQELAKLHLSGDIVEPDRQMALELAARGARLKHVGSARLLETIRASVNTEGDKE